jgi:hypothetical protein
MFIFAVSDTTYFVGWPQQQQRQCPIRSNRGNDGQRDVDRMMLIL